MDLIREIPSILQMPYEKYETDLSVPIAPMLEERQAAWDRRMTPRERNESWQACDGSYAVLESPLSTKLATIFPKKNGVLLSGRELIVAARINQLAAHRPEKPILAVDLGGMMGLSWMRLAVYFEELRSSNKLQLTSTNLEFNPDLLTKNNRPVGRANTPFLEPAEWRFWTKHRHAVHFVNANTKTLQDKLGKVDIIHEQNSVTYHSPIPALDRLRMLSALSSDGLLISSDSSTSFALGIDHLPFQKRELFAQAKTQDITNFNTALSKSLLYRKQTQVRFGDEWIPCAQDNSLSLIHPITAEELAVDSL